MSQLITPDLVLLDADLGTDRAGVIGALTNLVAEQGRATAAESLFDDAWAREQLTDTGVPGGIAIPHCRSEAVTEATLVMARLAPAVDFGAADAPADLIFLIAAPAGADQEHLTVLSALARSLVNPEFVDSLRAAATREEIVALVKQATAPEEKAAPAAAGAGAAAAGAAAATASEAPSQDANADSAARPVLIAVTACPTGIAHTYMAADSLAAAAERAGVELHVETQGSSGSTPLDPAVIAAASAVIFAVDVDVRDKARFAGKAVVQSPVKRGIDAPDAMIAEALAAASDPNATRVAGGGAASEATSSTSDEHFGQTVKRALLTGVSYMIPFVAGGGLLIALGFLLGGYLITETAGSIILENSLWNLPEGGIAAYLGAAAFQIGAASMGFLVPALAGYIAYAIADRPGIAPGFTAGAVAGLMGAGFLGGIVGGLLAGVAAHWLAQRKTAAWFRGLMPVVVIPLLASIFASGLMVLILGGPIASLTVALNDFLNGLNGASAIVLGLILGAMMGFDLGGPVNKVAYSFAVAGLGAGAIDNQGPWMIMAAVMASGMVAPLAMALASTVLARRLFSPVEKENGKAAWLLGASFISEGAIPFAAADPLRVIPASAIGSAVTGAIIMAFGVTSQAPHGGVFVFFAINPFPMFLVAIVAGTIVTALIVVALKRFVRKSDTVAPAAAQVPVAA
ncbi:PTS system D-fructose-specific IIA component (F1P-forming) (Frc family) /PTS system D-fructose-specific IIB component (F1P-forming) (Frc family) /PTS system D-fructose-specific IIC component (F1P-forming) (Frc family) [Salinibacterium amurskyense]|uniref:PTS system D-fructose-specific IIA component (F1P-forming) (Frc family) /PTS system D-fructose-specific IIB component (F1P-forming) (Frc family) /PTS system D-fructose-specific IIC component (F1P-f... n=1 Tax=Salinibacterium amurskyense TaxID=205941 RepID=A0A2M9D342_9MICO|nr:fructose-specific PTS transporter subunit EIIC [Salinibacterium amurskyense]PJJ78606.1 PTS system D-fructose-specific IIA component (F1P-forming) (Frc family) /PTS system D-fructose-specific IIB component (F1P-forming) (Frc family) /PTS system D-fructose-specific IIC component (F1P-forming) (Frc family) [Salinibacterium amurskyense]RLQ80692.1 PTS lactose transporter subunit IIC [Salinibacterium amurskyense]GHD82932.1 PTS lactose transporter subunit IIC [Salinibacterium amurskyense]